MSRDEFVECSQADPQPCAERRSPPWPIVATHTGRLSTAIVTRPWHAPVSGHRILKMRPTFERRPLRVVGIPVARAIFRFALVTPVARFHENDNPGASFIRCPHLLNWRST